VHPYVKQERLDKKGAHEERRSQYNPLFKSRIFAPFQIVHGGFEFREGSAKQAFFFALPKGGFNK